MRWSEPPQSEDGQPTIKNHSVTHFNGHLYCFGGYDGRRNHQTLLLYNIANQQWLQTTDSDVKPRSEVKVEGTPPPGRNGHTATLATDPNDEEHGRIIIIGGWLGQGPLAASDMHVLDVSSSGLRWYQPAVKGSTPGPCNMHSADFVPARREVYVFRGGNGREYLNDLHALHVDAYQWRKVETTGQLPQQRANHSSAYLEETAELFIFGGWNGRERLNDIHILDTATSNWTCPHVAGVLPHPRAGMTLTALRGRLFLFGGSGTSSKCFQDLQILDRKEMAWLDVNQSEVTTGGNRAVGSNYHEDDPDNSRMIGSVSDVENKGGGFAGSRADWRSRDNITGVVASPNPNDEDSQTGIQIQGPGPGRRAGHTATAVHRRLFIFGGSCGSDYLNDFFVLDTDPPPRACVNEPASLQLFERRLKHFFNDEEFSDVRFVVEGQYVYGHKLVLSIVSDCFRAMFTTGFRESEAGAEIEIPNTSYQAFLAMMEYIYSGRIPKLDIALDGNIEVNQVVDLMELADQFFLDHLKQRCEALLQSTVTVETVEYLHQVAQKTNSAQLLNICEHFERNHDGQAEQPQAGEGEPSDAAPVAIEYNGNDDMQA